MPENVYSNLGESDEIYRSTANFTVAPADTTRARLAWRRTIISSTPSVNAHLTPHISFPASVVWVMGLGHRRRAKTRIYILPVSQIPESLQSAARQKNSPSVAVSLSGGGSSSHFSIPECQDNAVFTSQQFGSSPNNSLWKCYHCVDPTSLNPLLGVVYP